MRKYIFSIFILGLFLTSTTLKIATLTFSDDISMEQSELELDNEEEEKDCEEYHKSDKCEIEFISQISFIDFLSEESYKYMEEYPHTIYLKTDAPPPRS